MSSAGVKLLLFAMAQVAADGIPIAWPNVKYDPVGSVTEYFAVHDLPGNKFAFGLNEIDIQPGIFQISCYVRTGVGEIKAASNADTIIAAFSRNSVLTPYEVLEEAGGEPFQVSDGAGGYVDFMVLSTGTKIHIDKSPWAGRGANQDNGWYMIPVSIPYKVIT